MDFGSLYMPYCLKKETFTKWVVLNRKYKPIGFNTDDWVKYREYPVVSKFKIGKKQLFDISVHDEYMTLCYYQDRDCVYLYDDKTNPNLSEENMKAYLIRLGYLFKNKIS